MKSAFLSTCPDSRRCHDCHDFGTVFDVVPDFWHQIRRHTGFWHRIWRHLRKIPQNRSNFGTVFDVISYYKGAPLLFWHRFRRQNGRLYRLTVPEFNFGTVSDVISWHFIILREPSTCFGTNSDVRMAQIDGMSVIESALLPVLPQKPMQNSFSLHLILYLTPILTSKTIKWFISYARIMIWHSFRRRNADP